MYRIYYEQFVFILQTDYMDLDLTDEQLQGERVGIGSTIQVQIQNENALSDP